MQLLDQHEQLLAHIIQALHNCPADERLMVGITGAPASGKSTLAASICEFINARHSEHSPAVVVPMDGFHLDNAILEKKGQMAVKGSPQTFDACGFLALLKRLSSGVSTQAVYFPEFDRSMDLSRCAANAVESHHRVIIVEGNYLLLQRPYWKEIEPLLALSIFLDVPMEQLESRLVKRWLDHGLDAEAARARALGNDIPNAQLVTEESADPHLMFKSMR